MCLNFLLCILCLPSFRTDLHIVNLSSEVAAGCSRSMQLIIIDWAVAFSTVAGLAGSQSAKSVANLRSQGIHVSCTCICTVHNYNTTLTCYRVPLGSGLMVGEALALGEWDWLNTVLSQRHGVGTLSSHEESLAALAPHSVNCCQGPEQNTVL